MVTLRIFYMGECPFDFDYTVDCIDSSTGFDFEPSFCGLFRVEPNWDELDWSEIFYFHPKLRKALVKKIDESYDGVRPDASSSSEEWDEYREYFVDVLQDIYVEFDINGTEYELHDVIEPEDLMTFEASDYFDDYDDFADSDDFDDYDDFADSDDFDDTDDFGEY